MLKGVEDYKQELKDKLDDIANAGDSQAVTDLIAAAKDTVENVVFDADKSLEDQKAALDAVAEALEKDIYEQRTDDYKAAVDALVGEADGENVKNAADRAKAEMDALVKPTEEQLKELLEEAKITIAIEKFKDEHAGEGDVLGKDFDDITAEDVSVIENAIEGYGKLDDTIKKRLDETVSAPYVSYLDELEDRLACAEFVQTKDEAIAEVESYIREHDGEAVRDVNKTETDKIGGMTYTPQSAADRENYVATLNDSVAKAEDLGILATKQAQFEQITLNTAKAEEAKRAESGQYNATQKDQLSAIVDEIQKKVEGLPTATTEEELAENKKQMDIWLEEVNREMGEVPKIGVSNGNIDLNDCNNAEYEEGTENTVWGIITNDSTMPGGVELVIEKLGNDRIDAAKDIVNKNDLIVAAGSNINALQLMWQVRYKEIVAAMNVYLMKDDVKITEFEGVYTVKILLTEEQRNMGGLQIVSIKENGEVEVFETTIEDGKYLVFKTTYLSEFYMLEGVSQYMNLLWLLLLFLIVFLVVVYKKAKEDSNRYYRSHGVK